MIRTLIVAVALVALGGCVATTPERHYSERDLSAPLCWESRECELMWAAARRWVLDNSSRKIQHITDDYIETYNPAPNSPRIAVRVVKEPLSKSGYRISCEIWCDNIYGCSPDKLEAEVSFNRYVKASTLLAPSEAAGSKQMQSKAASSESSQSLPTPRDNIEQGILKICMKQWSSDSQRFSDCYTEQVSSYRKMK